jgi:cytochrome P450
VTISPTNLDGICQLTSSVAAPHLLTEDDVYEGYLIPAGSTVIGNVWAILHDPEFFPNPESFHPERFLKPDTMDRFPDAVFGFGRRVCPGRHMARSSVWIAVASILAAFEIAPARDENGAEIPIVEEYTSGVVS